MGYSLPQIGRTVNRVIVESRASINRARYRKKLIGYIGIPAFSVDSVWRGASEIVKEFRFTLDKAPTILRTLKVNPNYCACIAWKPTSETIVRYKLWQDVGEILFVDLYAGEKIPVDFSIEIWNTPTTPTSSLGTETFILSELVEPPNDCYDSDTILITDPEECYDVTLTELPDFVPIDGDYFAVIGDCGETQLIKNRIFADEWLIKADDDTWRSLKLTAIDGVIYSYTEAAEIPDPEPTPYMPLRDRFSGIGFQIKCGVISNPEGDTYHPYADGFVDDDVTDYGVIYLKADDDNYYGVRLIVEDWRSHPYFFPLDLQVTGTFRIEIDQVSTEYEA